jgi:hypothetical protein
MTGEEGHRYTQESDNTSSEAIKADTETIVTILHNFKKIWENEDVPA